MHRKSTAVLFVLLMTAMVALVQQRADATPRQQCIYNCAPHRGTLDESAAAMRGYTYGPRAITYYRQGKVMWFEVQYRNGHKILRVHAKAAYYPPGTPTRSQ